MVFVQVSDPVGAGFVANLARPGGNITGFTLQEYGISAKWLELLKQIAPRITRAAILRDPSIPTGVGHLAAIQSVAPSLRVDLSPVDMRDTDGFGLAVAQFAREPYRAYRAAWLVDAHAPRTNHRAGGRAPIARRLPLPLLRRRWRLDLLRT